MPQVWLWLVLSGLGGGVLGWWIRSRQASGREMKSQRSYDRRLTAVEEDAKRALDRSRTDAKAKWHQLEYERDMLRERVKVLEADAGLVPAKTRGGRAKPASALAAASSALPQRRPQRIRVNGNGNGAPANGNGNGNGNGHGNGSLSPAAPDDLKKINGIGPAYEELLNELGYSTFQDVAGWSSEEIDRLAERLGARIRLEDWSAQAGELFRAKHGALN